MPPGLRQWQDNARYLPKQRRTERNLSISRTLALQSHILSKCTKQSFKKKNEKDSNWGPMEVYLAHSGLAVAADVCTLYLGYEKNEGARACCRSTGGKLVVVLATAGKG